MRPIEVLMDVMPPPDDHVDIPSLDDWASIECRMGVSLPLDYKQLVDRYGTGAIDGFLWILNPFSKNRYLNLVEQAVVIVDALRRLRDEFNESIPYEFGGDGAGLFPWAVTDNGDTIYWLRSGDPKNWIIVVNEARGPRWREFNMSTCEFLFGVVSKQLRVDVFPSDFPSESPAFVRAKV